MAKGLSVAVKMQQKATEMSAPDIVDLVSPATVFLEVKSGPGGGSAGVPQELSYISYWHETSMPDSRSFRSMGSRHENFHGTIVVGETGLAVKDDPKTMLPWLVGSSCLIGIESLPSTAPGRTTSTQRISIRAPETQQRRSRFSPFGLDNFGPANGPPWMGPRVSGPETTKVMIGTESTTMVMGDFSKSAIDLEKTYSLRVDGDANTETTFAIEGTGNGHFDPIAGRMLDMDYRLTIEVNQTNVTLRIPVTLTYRIVDEERLQKEVVARQERAKARSQEKAKATSSPTSALSTRDQADDKKNLHSVKDAPKSSNLNKFNFEK